MAIIVSTIPGSGSMVYKFDEESGKKPEISFIFCSKTNMKYRLNKEVIRTSTILPLDRTPRAILPAMIEIIIVAIII